MQESSVALTGQQFSHWEYRNRYSTTQCREELKYTRRRNLGNARR